ncbi:hypothetical protein AU500_00755 [Lonsdalea populi]|uniref:Uncharacterized protein n=2 Tax=Lonsdalea TaxID=1082702 RepID=A0ACD1J8M5_9GAMM|nr:hypothetical protein AU499_02575 [Lonsdalea populi]RAT09625.1 hypothetical protein AU485_17345 [Lonsdalea quercina]QPQ23068.1 hypothetical protein I6N93_10285 [Lonsdalea populi]RAT17957.1 hypothetical protein AU488_17415 [Lonsdalea populi]RAT19121.1 hypothetical protein AU487_12405 [Lonsdalea populi]
MSVTALIVALETLKAYRSSISRLMSAVTYTEGEQTDNLLLNLVRQGGLMLFDELRLESADAVTQRGQFKRAGSGFGGFLAGAIFPTSFNILSQMGVEFSGQRRFG